MRGPKPPPKFCLATRRETGEIICLEQFEASLGEGSSLFRKNSKRWQDSRNWRYCKGWKPNETTTWEVERAVNKSPFVYNYAAIVADTLEDAINEYRNQNRPD